MNHSAKVLFWLYKSKKNRQGLIPIYMRVTFNKNKMEIATGHFVHLKQWNKRKKRLAENSDTNAEIKKALEIMRMRIISIFNQISTSEESFGLTTIKKMFYGKHEKANSLMKAVEYHNNKVKLLIGKSYAKGTYDNYHYLETKLKSFLMHSLKLQISH